ncbi:hypothetical protein [Hyphococcus sp.]|uniref:hypothetical protein n=1 Tax=Hyphococcus sp. TaxID=2038636 RepID=UPI002089FA83|nr:MAG: hypothetical protein DHS20C04_25000 [Marinicaulis sp.]
MSGGALSIPLDNAAAKAMRIPSLPGRLPGAPQVDVESSAYRAGHDAAQAETRAQLAEQEARHEAFVQSVGGMLSEMDARYRKESLSLIERMFAAVAPALAIRSSLADIMHIVEERAMRDHSELTLRVHPSLIAHLSEKEQRKLGDTPLITLNADEKCAPAMVDAEWRKGGLFHDPDSLIEQLLLAMRNETAPQEETGNE